MAESPPEEALRGAVDALAEAEKLIGGIGRDGLVKKLDEIRDFLDEVNRLQMVLRMARTRLQAYLPDPDKTPAHGVSTASLRRIEVQK